MDFDEYDYLEKTVENADFSKVANGRDSRGDASKKRNEEEDDYARSKRARVYEDDERVARKEERYRERDSEPSHSRSRDGDRERRRERSHSRSRDAYPERERERSHSRSRDADLRRERERSHSRSRDIDLRRDRERSHSRSRDVDPRRERSHSRSRGVDPRSRDVDPRRERSHSRSRDVVDSRRDRSHSRSRDVVDPRRERSHSRSCDADLEKPRERSHSRARDLEYNRDIERDKERRDSRETEFRYSKEKKSKKEDSPAAEPEADPERDQRTVFAYQICLKADERDVYEFFSKAGKVRDVRLIMDRNSRRSKGVGYIEFYDAMSVPMAIAMSGQLLRGLPVMVKPSEAEKNLVQSTAAAGIAGVYTSNPGIARRLYVGNLHFNITEDQLRQVFEPFGIVELVQLPTDPETGQCKGYGFVQYARLEDARTAQAALNGVLELAGRIIKVSSVTEQPGMQEMGVTPGELDDDDGGGLALTARSRALLMQKLDRTGTVSSITASILPPVVSPPLGILAPVGGSGIPPVVVGSVLGQIGHPGVASMQNATLLATASGLAGVEPIGAPSECLLLRNMFDPATETEPDFDLDIRDEVQQECSKFGVVKHIFVDKNSAGHVYIRFDGLSSAAKAQQALHGRWFAGKMITTSLLTARAYETKFPESK